MLWNILGGRSRARSVLCIIGSRMSARTLVVDLDLLEARP